MTLSAAPSSATQSSTHAVNLLTALFGATLILSGCTRSVEPLSTVQPLPAAPAGTVSAQPLGAPNQPGTPGAIDPATGLPFPPAGTQVATTEPVAQPSVSATTSVSSEPLDRGSVAGVWNVQVAGGTCRVATSFTRRSTHFQASPLRCPDAELSNVREWNVSGNQMVLYDGSGSAVARLFRTGAQRLDGKTSGGTAVTLSRDS
ncbi:MAG: AprI/Inh family metalloprotease inhibitor [Pseudomonadota bacterium]